MSTYTKEQLAEIIGNHRKWLDDEEGGELADLSGADLSDANLRGADLSDANIRGADLRGADLSDANLRGANLRGANLRGANLRGAYLRGANLRGAYLRGADLSDANLRGANLRGANLRGADLSGANLRGADLRGADLRDLRSMWGASGNCAEIKAIQCDLWPVTYTATHMQIGCQLHAFAEWWEFSDDEISRMDSQALDWWLIWKPILAQIIEVSPAVPGATEEESNDAA